jgi:hypothetical protein
MSDFFSTKMLLTGQSAPYTGEWVGMGRSRDNLFTAYGTSSGSIALQYFSPFFINDGVPFYTIQISGSGYATPAYSTSPMEQVRAICSGTGTYWVAVAEQN